MKNIDLAGQKFERLTVIKLLEIKNGAKYWECLCDCGNLTRVSTSRLIRGKTKSCGCLRDEKASDTKIDLLNQMFGTLLVIDYAENIGTYTAWLCRCDCGNEKIIKSTSLTTGKSITCGCKINKFINNDPKMSSAKTIFNSKYNDGNLTFEQFIEISQKNCFYCNISPSNSTNRLDSKCRNDRRKRDNQFSGEIGTFVYNGLDRVDSSQGHDLNNVVSCCYACNWSKSNLTVDEFKEWVIRIYEFWIKEKAR